MEVINSAVYHQVKNSCHVEPISVGKPHSMKSTHVPATAFQKEEDLRWGWILIKFFKEFTQYHLIELHKTPKNHVGNFFYKILLKSIGLTRILPIKYIWCFHINTKKSYIVETITQSWFTNISARWHHTFSLNYRLFVPNRVKHSPI